MLTQGIDISNWSGEITLDQFKRAKENHDIQFVVIGTQTDRITRAQLLNAALAELDTELYVYLYFDGHDSERISRAIEIVKSVGHVNRIWLDIEYSEEYPPGNAPRMETLLNCITALHIANISVGIYTSKVMWDAMGFTEENARQIAGAGFPLWVANYVNRPLLETDFTEWKDNPAYIDDAWPMPTVWQHRNTTTLEGITCCLDTRYVEVTDTPEIPIIDDAKYAHALAYAYVAWNKRDNTMLHPFDKKLVRDIADWLGE